MTAASESASSPSGDMSAPEVAGMFAQMTWVSAEFNRQLELIAAAPQPLSQATVDALTRLLAIVAPAARTREQMASLPPALLMAGIQEWISQPSPAGGGSARGRAGRAWSVGGAR